jgi:hypothetical protein
MPACGPPAALPAGAVIASTLLILSAILATILFGLDYIDYRRRRNAKIEKIKIGKMKRSKLVK